MGGKVSSQFLSKKVHMYWVQVFILLFSLVFLQEKETFPAHRVGETLKEVIKDEDPVVYADAMDKNYTQAPTIGKRYFIRISEPGHYTIGMKLLFFDAYLVLLDNEGRGLAEDSYGLYRTHSRIVFQSRHKGALYNLKACALHGGRGDNGLKLISGKEKELEAKNVRVNLEHIRVDSFFRALEKGPKNQERKTR